MQAHQASPYNYRHVNPIVGAINFHAALIGGPVSCRLSFCLRYSRRESGSYSTNVCCFCMFREETFCTVYIFMPCIWSGLGVGTVACSETSGIINIIVRFPTFARSDVHLGDFFYLFWARAAGSSGCAFSRCLHDELPLFLSRFSYFLKIVRIKSRFKTFVV